MRYIAYALVVGALFLASVLLRAYVGDTVHVDHHVWDVKEETTKERALRLLDEGRFRCTPLQRNSDCVSCHDAWQKYRPYIYGD